MLSLPQPETRVLTYEFHEVAVGTLLGIGVLALVQGTLFGGLGFWIFGVPKPLVWGALGGRRVAVAGRRHCHRVRAGRDRVDGDRPCVRGHRASGVLGRRGRYLGARLLAAAAPDEGAHVPARAARAHAAFGGIEAFGAIGLLVGPMFVAMFVAMLRIDQRNYRLPSTERRVAPKGREGDDVDKDAAGSPRGGNPPHPHHA